MSAAIELKVEVRQDTGKGSARSLRREGRIPAIVYGAGVKEPVKLSIELAEFLKQYQRRGFKSRLLELKAGKESYCVLPRDVQTHPVNDIPEHADFYAVTDKTTLKVMVPVRFFNHDKAPGIKRGGTLNIVRRDLELSCTPANIPEVIEIDLAGRRIGDSIHVSHIELPENVTPVIQDRDFTIAALVGRRGMKEETEEAVEGEEAAEGGDE